MLRTLEEIRRNIARLEKHQEVRRIRQAIEEKKSEILTLEATLPPLTETISALEKEQALLENFRDEPFFQDEFQRSQAEIQRAHETRNETTRSLELLQDNLASLESSLLEESTDTQETLGPVPEIPEDLLLDDIQPERTGSVSLQDTEDASRETGNPQEEIHPEAGSSSPAVERLNFDADWGSEGGDEVFPISTLIIEGTGELTYPHRRKMTSDKIIRNEESAKKEIENTLKELSEKPDMKFVFDFYSKSTAESRKFLTAAVIKVLFSAEEVLIINGHNIPFPTLAYRLFSPFLKEMEIDPAQKASEFYQLFSIGSPLLNLGIKNESSIESLKGKFLSGFFFKLKEYPILAPILLGPIYKILKEHLAPSEFDSRQSRKCRDLLHEASEKSPLELLDEDVLYLRRELDLRVYEDYSFPENIFQGNYLSNDALILGGVLSDEEQSPLETANVFLSHSLSFLKGEEPLEESVIALLTRASSGQETLIKKESFLLKLLESPKETVECSGEFFQLNVHLAVFLKSLLKYSQKGRWPERLYTYFCGEGADIKKSIKVDGSPRKQFTKSALWFVIYLTLKTDPVSYQLFIKPLIQAWIPFMSKRQKQNYDNTLENVLDFSGVEEEVLSRAVDTFLLSQEVLYFSDLTGREDTGRRRFTEKRKETIGFLLEMLDASKEENFSAYEHQSGKPIPSPESSSSSDSEPEVESGSELDGDALGDNRAASDDSPDFSDSDSEEEIILPRGRKRFRVPPSSSEESDSDNSNAETEMPPRKRRRTDYSGSDERAICSDASHDLPEHDVDAGAAGADSPEILPLEEPDTPSDATDNTSETASPIREQAPFLALLADLATNQQPSRDAVVAPLPDALPGTPPECSRAVRIPGAREREAWDILRSLENHRDTTASLQAVFQALEPQGREETAAQPQSSRTQRRIRSDKGKKRGPYRARLKKQPLSQRQKDGAVSTRRRAASGRVLRPSQRALGFPSP